MTRPLPPKAIAALEFITAHITEHHYPPTYREIQAKTGMSTKSLVAYHLGLLRTAGLIAWTPKAPRSIRLVDNAAAQI